MRKIRPASFGDGMGAVEPEQIVKPVETLARVDAKLLGVVLNRVPSKKNNDYGYTYTRTEADAPTHQRRSRATTNSHKVREAES